MTWFNRKKITTHRLGDGWQKLKVERGGTRLEGAFKTKQQFTVELTYPYIETITIESSSPLCDESDLTHLAEELALLIDYRHKARRKQKIRDNEATFRTKILPLWFEREAFIARNRAEKEDIRKQAKRELNADKMELKEYNDLVRALKGRCDDDDFIDGVEEYLRHLNLELRRINIESDFYLSQPDLRDIFGKNTWAESLQIREVECVQPTGTIVTIQRGFKNFSDLYGLDYKLHTMAQLRAECDTIEVAGFGDIILASALKKGGKVVAVMAIDDVQGRRALRQLVGAERLAEVLPKRAYNAVMREENFVLGEVKYSENSNVETIIVE